MVETENAPEIIKVRGTITTGIGESKLFTETPWVRKQFRKKLGIDPYPGTLNIIVLPEDINKLDAIHNMKGIEIVPEDVNYCTGKSFIALINGKIRGAVIIPQVPNYPEAQLEIISTEYIKQSLSFKDGDVIEVEIYK